MISVTVRLSGLIIRECADMGGSVQHERRENLPDGFTVSQLVNYLERNHPCLNMKAYLVVLNNELINNDRNLRDGDVVAFYPPAMGG